MKNNKKEFFNMLAEKLEEQFPKGECKERGQALVLNSWANVLFDRYIAQAQKDLLDEVERKMLKSINKAIKHGANYPIGGGVIMAELADIIMKDLKSLISQKRKELG